MSEDDHRKHHFFRPIEPKCLKLLRSGEGPDTAIAIKSLRIRCRRYVLQGFRGYLTDDEVEDVVSDAISDVMRYIQDPGLTISALNQRMRRSLEKHKKRRKRYHLRIVQQDEDSPSGYRYDDDFKTTEHRIDFQRLVGEISQILEEAFFTLRVRDQGLLVDLYDLRGLVTPTDVPAPTFRTDAARRKALERARSRFNTALEGSLQSATRHTKFDRETLQRALQIVRGEAID